MINFFFTKQDKVSKRSKVLLSVIFSLIIVIIVASAILYYKIYSHNIIATKEESKVLLIYKNDNVSKILKKLSTDLNCIKDTSSLKWVMKIKKYKPKSGRYIINKELSNNQIINKLRSGDQDPIDFTFNNIRKIEDFVSIASRKLMMDSIQLSNTIVSNEFQGKQNYTTESFLTRIIPNTYNVYWNTSPESLIIRLFKESDVFWRGKKDKLDKIQLTKKQVITLASIVEEETSKIKEMPIVAGVYINRLKKRMRLQADPTVKFAVGDFSLKRILNYHLRIDSPYNTYKYYGLPPGPIRLPSLQAINAVLNYKTHNYLYFCAKADFSGYHVFARTLKQHNRNARAYRRALDKNGY